MRFLVALSLSFTLLLVSAQMAPAHELEPEEAGHPLKAARLVLHPVGYILYHGIVRPTHWLISRPGAEKVFGHEERCCEGRSAEPCDKSTYSVPKGEPVPCPEAQGSAPPPGCPHAAQQQ